MELDQLKTELLRREVSAQSLKRGIEAAFEKCFEKNKDYKVRAQEVQGVLTAEIGRLYTPTLASVIARTIKAQGAEICHLDGTRYYRLRKRYAAHKAGHP